MQVLENMLQSVGIDPGRVGHAAQRLFVAIQFLEQLGLDIRTRKYIGDIEQRRHRGARMPFFDMRQVELQLLEQVRHAQPGPALFVQRVLEENRFSQWSVLDRDLSPVLSASEPAG